MTFGELLRAHRKRNGLTQDTLGRAIGLSQPYLNHLENGRVRSKDGKPRQPAREIVLSMAAALGLDAAETDRFLFAAGLAPRTDWQALYEQLTGGLDAWLADQKRAG